MFSRTSPHKKSILVLILASLMVALVAGWQYLQLRKNVSSYGADIVAMISAVPLSQLSSLDVQENFLRTAVKNSPVPGQTYIQIVNATRQVLNQYASDPGNIPEIRLVEQRVTAAGLKNSEGGLVEFYAPVLNAEEVGTFVRVGFDTSIPSFFSNHLTSLLAGFAPAILLAGIFYLYRNRSHKPMDGSQELVRRLFRRIPHDKFEVALDSGPDGHAHNLELLVKSTEKYLNKVESDRSTLNTSAKVLAYQKFNSESILRSVPDAVLVLDESGQVTFANQQFLRWYRLSAEEVVGKMPSVWCERPALLGFLRRYNGKLARRAESGAPESDPPGKPGATLSLTAFPMFSSRDEQHISSTLIVFSDVTKEVLAEKARDEFAAALAHELKTPLHSIGLHAEMLMSEDGGDEDMRIDSANFINTEVEHIGELIRNMLNITRIETGSLSINRKLTKIGDLLKNSVENMSTNAAENNISVRLEMPDSVEPSYLDKDLLRVAINNLLSNAIKYNKPGGEVTVSLTEADSALVLVVADTGLGISEEEQEKVFEKFFRSEEEEVRNRSGHGLGLSLVREIIELHNGSVSLESVPGEGSRFTIRLKKINVPLQEAA